MDTIDLKDWISDENITLLTRAEEVVLFRKIHLIVCRSCLLLREKIPSVHQEEYSRDLYKAERKINFIQKYLIKGSFQSGQLKLLQEDFRTITNTFISHNLRLVISIARKYYSNKGVSFFDLVHEGILGLLVTVFKFDYTFLCKFSTYTIHWIKQKMFRCVNDNIRLVKLPMHTISSLYRVQQVIESEDKDDKVNRLIRRMHYLPKRRIVLEHNIQDRDNDSPSLQDSLVDETVQSDYDVFRKESYGQIMNKFTRNLDPIGERIIRLRFGLCNFGSFTQEETACSLMVDKSLVQRLETSKLRKLKQWWQKSEKGKKIF